jgi:hypothetical protein
MGNPWRRVYPAAGAYAGSRETTLITNLAAICGLAFLTVFALLAVLALAMRALTAAFPVRQDGLDSAVVAAISSTVTSLAPGARVVRIEEI